MSRWCTRSTGTLHVHGADQRPFASSLCVSQNSTSAQSVQWTMLISLAASFLHISSNASPMTLQATTRRPSSFQFSYAMEQEMKLPDKSRYGHCKFLNWHHLHASLMSRLHDHDRLRCTLGVFYLSPPPTPPCANRIFHCMQPRGACLQRFNARLHRISENDAGVNR